MPFEIMSASLTDTGFKVSFTEALEGDVMPKVSSWHYHYWSTYGSPRVDEKTLPITNLKLANDRKSITFDVELAEGKVYAIDFSGQKNADGEELGSHTIFYTINKTRLEPVAPQKVTELDLLESDGFAMNTRWQIVDGVLSPSEKPGGLLFTKNAYEDFTLNLEYKTSEKCNSGVFFRTDPKNPVQGGMEIQIASPSMYKGRHVVGSIFDAKAAIARASKPDGEWNQFTLHCVGSKIEVTINGTLVQKADLNDWDTPRKNPDGSKNKFKTALKDLPRSGHIGLQYHGQPIFYRNIKLIEH